MISSATVTVLRRIARQGMTETCDLYAADKTIDATGAVNNGVILQQAGVACRVVSGKRTNDSQIVANAGVEEMTDNLTLILPAGTIVATDYEVVHGGVRYTIGRVVDALTDGAFVSCVITRRR